MSTSADDVLIDRIKGAHWSAWLQGAYSPGSREHAASVLKLAGAVANAHKIKGPARFMYWMSGKIDLSNSEICELLHIARYRDSLRKKWKL